MVGPNSEAGGTGGQGGLKLFALFSDAGQTGTDLVDGKAAVAGQVEEVLLVAIKINQALGELVAQQVGAALLIG